MDRHATAFAGFACALALFLACGGGKGAGVRRSAVDGTGVDGISALARDDRGRLWMAAEHDRFLLWLVPGGSPKRIRLEGVGAEVDVESLAYLGRGRFAIGTEPIGAPSGTETDQAGIVLFAVLDPEAHRVMVTGRLEIDPAMWGLRMRANKGIEGLCRAGRFLVAGIETVAVEGNRRYAPIAVYDLQSGNFRAHRLQLESTTGTLSGLACRWQEESLRAIAIERHFGVTRLLAFSIPDRSGDIAAPYRIDLDDLAREASLNFEGIEIVGDSIVLAVDNEYRTITGPNELVYVPLPDDWSTGMGPAIPPD